MTAIKFFLASVVIAAGAMAAEPADPALPLTRDQASAWQSVRAGLKASRISHRPPQKQRELTDAERAEIGAIVLEALNRGASDEEVFEAAMATLRRQGHRLTPEQTERLRATVFGILSQRRRGSPSDDLSCGGCSSLDHCDNGRCISNGNSGHCSSIEHDDGSGRCVSNSSGLCSGTLHWNGSGCN